MHSAEWKSEVGIRSKKVGVVGSGTSAIQIIPAIANDVENLTVFQRRPAWILPRPQIRIPQCIQTLFRYIPGIMWLLRISIFWAFEVCYISYFQNSFMNRIWSKMGAAYLKYSIQDDVDLRQKLEPNYAFGCKRPGLHSKYYDTMRLPNVKLVTSSIKEVREHSIITENGDEIPIDVLILATGFRFHEYYAPLEIIGINGVKPIGNWINEGPSTFKGIVNHSLPNLFFICGPSTMPGHTSVLFTMECQANWCLLDRASHAINYMKVDQLKSYNKESCSWLFYSRCPKKLKNPHVRQKQYLTRLNAQWKA